MRWPAVLLLPVLALAVVACKPKPNPVGTWVHEPEPGNGKLPFDLTFSTGGTATFGPYAGRWSIVEEEVKLAIPQRIPFLAPPDRTGTTTLHFRQKEGTLWFDAHGMPMNGNVIFRRQEK